MPTPVLYMHTYALFMQMSVLHMSTSVLYMQANFCAAHALFCFVHALCMSLRCTFIVHAVFNSTVYALSLVGATNSYAIFKQFQVWRFLVSPLITAGILHFLCIVGIQLEILHQALMLISGGQGSYFPFYLLP